MSGSNNINKRFPESEGTTKRKINLRILGQDGILVYFEVKRDMPIRKVLLKYCEKKNLEYSAVIFLYNGSRVLVRRTPEELHMEDDDLIEAMAHVDGGGRDKE